jgi:hypothetical protein
MPRLCRNVNDSVVAQVLIKKRLGFTRPPSRYSLGYTPEANAAMAAWISDADQADIKQGKHFVTFSLTYDPAKGEHGRVRFFSWLRRFWGRIS